MNAGLYAEGVFLKADMKLNGVIDRKTKKITS